VPADPDAAAVSPEGANRERLAAFGTWLVRERELRGLSRDEVGRATKLAPAVVEALESGEEGRIPPRTYVVGYLRAYASAVGLDSDEVVLRFEEAAGPARARAATRRGKLPSRTLAVAAVAAAIAAAIAWALVRS
jgi:cytoskeletal protein RodZ